MIFDAGGLNIISIAEHLHTQIGKDKPAPNWQASLVISPGLILAPPIPAVRYGSIPEVRKS